MKDRIPNPPYKAKRVTDGQWVLGYLLKKPSGYFIDSCNEFAADGLTSLQVDKVDEETICRAMNDMDFNKNTLYQGDILRYRYHPDLKDEVTDNELLHQVIWMENGFYLWRWRSGDMSPINPNGLMNGFERVGNIFDNPELLG